MTETSPAPSASPNLPIARSLTDRLALAIAIVAGLGRLRPASGTWASATAAAAVWAWVELAQWPLPVWGLPLAALIATVLGIWAAGRAGRVLDDPDPSVVVIDEVAGQWLALAVLPLSVLQASPLLACAAAFVAFRVFDIFKPWPICACERLPGGWGVMIDDLVAGLAAGLVLWPILA